ncbi:MAG: hypothetical protein AABX98_00335 [Nanoarchaeota archaeon]
MTSDGKKDKLNKNDAIISAAHKKRQEAGKVASGPGTATASLSTRGLKLKN